VSLPWHLIRPRSGSKAIPQGGPLQGGKIKRFRCIWIDRGTDRKPLSDYTADETSSTLAGVPDLFTRLGWMSAI